MAKKNSSKKSKSKKTTREPVAPFELLKWVFHEFGFALLLLSFSLGTLALGLGLQELNRLQVFTQYSSQAQESEEVCVEPASPKNVRARTGWEESGQIVVTWQKVPKADHYALSFGKQSGQYEFGSVNVGSVEEYTLGNLVNGDDYYISVAAVNECGMSPYSREVMAVASGTFDEAAMAVAEEGDETGGSDDVVQAAPVVRPYDGPLPQELQQPPLVTRLVTTVDDWAPWVESVLMERSYRLLTAGVVLFLSSGLLALIGLRHMRVGVKQSKDSVGLGFGSPGK